MYLLLRNVTDFDDAEALSSIFSFGEVSTPSDDSSSLDDVPRRGFT
jgi:hypothetical protein